MSFLELRDVAVRYGAARAVDGVSLAIEAGSITAIVGPNGAGKTSLLKAICGLVGTHAGEIHFAGQRIDGLPARAVAALGVAHVPEGRRVFAKMTVADNLRLGAYLQSDRAATRKMLDEVHAAFPRLRERMDQRAGSLSGGEQQMLAIGRAMMAAPRLVMADEVSQGLAPVVVQEVYRQLAALRERGATILLVEQNARIAFKIATTVFVMEQGRVVLSGPTVDVARSEHVRNAYLGIGA